MYLFMSGELSGAALRGPCPAMFKVLLPLPECASSFFLCELSVVILVLKKGELCDIGVCMPYATTSRAVPTSLTAMRLPAAGAS